MKKFFNKHAWKFAWRQYKQHPRAIVADVLIYGWIALAIFSRINVFVLIALLIPVVMWGAFVYKKDIKPFRK